MSPCDRPIDDWSPCPARTSVAKLALAILQLSERPEDVRTLAQWARQIGTNRTAVIELCRATRLRPKNVRDFARVLRALRCADWNVAHIDGVLDVSDARTRRVLLSRAGCTGVTRLTLGDFLRQQTFVPPDHPVLVALLKTIRQSTSSPSITLDLPSDFPSNPAPLR
jgi:hypothetical protein